MSPFSELWIENAEAAEVSRHTYEFSDGTTEYIALYQGGNADSGAKISLPKGAEVTDVQMTLSGASATGWSSIPTTTRDHWVAGEASNTDNKSSDLTLAMANVSQSFNPHSMDEDANPSSTAWLDNGTYAVRQPHTSNSTDALFSQQRKLTPNSLNAQGQGAVLRHHDWLYLSTWSSTSFHNIVHRLYPNNGTRESIITLDQNGCTLPSKHSSSYYGQYGFRDWVVTDDERLFAGRRREDDATTTRGLTTRRRSRRAVSNALFELTAMAGLDVRREVHDAVLELSRARVVPTATAQVLRSLASKAADARAAGLEDALRAPARE